MKSIILVITTAAYLAAQSANDVPGANQGAALTGTATPSVKEVVSVQAVMLPYTVNRELFSRHIADNYVAVVINVGNRSHDAALVMEGLYLDYTKWALSGTVSRPGEFGSLNNYSSGTLPGQVSSVEYRIVRGELEERDPKTIRNWILRSLQLAGSIAGGTTFLYDAASDIPKFLSLVNGVAIPGFEKLWPDALISKLNRISDFGYRVNRIVPRESSDIMIAFFPIERFLTPTLKKIFITHPALFFNTGLALVDPNIPADMKKILQTVTGQQDLSSFVAQVPDVIACQTSNRTDAGACARSLTLRRLVASTSLNSIEVVIDGSMVVDTSAIPAVVDTVAFQTGGDPAAYWTQNGSDKGIVVTGRYLDGATVAVEPADAGITWASADATASTTEKLSGKLSFAKPLTSGTQLSIKLVKQAKDGRTVTSLVFPYTVNFSQGQPDPTAVTSAVSGRKLTLTGKNLSNAVLSIMLTETAPKAASGVLVSGVTINSDGTATFDVKSLDIGCYKGQLFTPTALPELKNPILIVPAPTVTKATQKGTTVTLEGKDLLSLSTDCKIGSPTFKVTDDKSAEVAVTAGAVDATGKTATFTYNTAPAAAAKLVVTVTSGTTTTKPVAIDVTP